jgi:hypothetical protein
MPFKKLRRVSTALAVGAMVMAAPTAAMAAACPPEHAMSKPFSVLGDFNDYFMAPGGDFEVGEPAWSYKEDYGFGIGRVDVFGGPRYLKLDGGAKATSPGFCVDTTYTHLRLFVDSTSNRADLRVEAVKPDGAAVALTVLDGEEYADWSLTPFIPLAGPLNLGPGDAIENVKLRFWSIGREIRVDAIAVDPYRR